MSLAKKILGQSISYRIEEKAGAPIVFLIHGFAGSPDDWSLVVESLKENYTVVVPWFKFFTPGPNEKRLPFRTQVDILEQFIGEVGQDQQSKSSTVSSVLYTVASSYGSALVKAVVTRNNEKLSGVVMLSPMPFFPWSKIAMTELKWLLALTKFPTVLFLALQFGFGTKAIKAIERLFHAPWLKDDDRNQTKKGIFKRKKLTHRKKRLLYHLLRTFYHTIRNEDWSFWESRSHLIKVPVLILCGQDDHLFIDGENVKLQKSISESQLDFIPHAGHLSMIEAPFEVADRSHAFFNSVEAKRPK